MVEADGKLMAVGPLLDMDPDELDQQMQAEFERQESGRRGNLEGDVLRTLSGEGEAMTEVQSASASLRHWPQSLGRAPSV